MMRPAMLGAAIRRRLYGERSPEAGDTLVEVLVALVVISIAGVALLGGLLTSAGASTIHRNTTNVDAVLQNFAETANADVGRQLKAGSPCAGSYPITGSPLPNSAPPGAPVTTFATGFAADSPLTASLLPAAGTTPWQVATTSSSGSATATFTIPAVVPGSYQLTLTDGSGNAAAPVSLTVQSTSTPPPATPSYTGYTLSMTPAAVDPSAFLTPARAPCQLALSATDDDPGHAATGQLTIVVASLTSLKIPTVTVTPASTTVNVTSSVTLAAKVTGLAGVPTGTVTWANLPPGHPESDCTSTMVTLAAGQATCTIDNLQPGSSSPIATYSGDGTYTGGVGQTVVTVNKLAATLAVTAAPAISPAPGTLTFTATLTGTVGTPTGNVTWSGLPAGASLSGCPNPTPLVSGSATCSLSQVPPVANLTLSAAYSGDDDYLPATVTSTPAVTVAGAEVTVSGPASPQPLGSTLTFTAGVAGNSVPPSGTVTWSFTAGTPAGTQACPTATLRTAPTCTVTGANAGTFAPVATYSGDANYPAASGRASPVTVGMATPAVAVTGSLVLSTVTFTATLTGTSGVPITGPVAWTVSGSDGSTPACPTVNLPAGPITCTVANASSTAKYTATATYSGDLNYTGANGASGPVKG